MDDDFKSKVTSKATYHFFFELGNKKHTSWYAKCILLLEYLQLHTK